MNKVEITKIFKITISADKMLWTCWCSVKKCGVKNTVLNNPLWWCENVKLVRRNLPKSIRKFCFLQRLAQRSWASSLT